MATRKRNVPAPAAANVAPVIGHNVGTAVDATVAKLLPVLLSLATADADAALTREDRKGAYTAATEIAADCTGEEWNAAAAEIDRRQACNVDGLATKLGLPINGKEKGKWKLCRSWTAAKYVLTKAHEFGIPMLGKEGKPLAFGKIRQEVLGEVAKRAAEKAEGADKVKLQISAALAALKTLCEGVPADRLDATLLALQAIMASIKKLTAAAPATPAEAPATPEALAA